MPQVYLIQLEKQNLTHFKQIIISSQVVAILKGHAKKVNRVVYHSSEDVVITASHDATIRIWDVGTSQTIKMLRIHEGPVTGLSLHATGDYILSTSTDQVSSSLSMHGKNSAVVEGVFV